VHPFAVVVIGVDDEVDEVLFNKVVPTAAAAAAVGTAVGEGFTGTGTGTTMTIR